MGNITVVIIKFYVTVVRFRFVFNFLSTNILPGNYKIQKKKPIWMSNKRCRLWFVKIILDSILFELVYRRCPKNVIFTVTHVRNTEMWKYCYNDVPYMHNLIWLIVLDVIKQKENIPYFRNDCDSPVEFNVNNTFYKVEYLSCLGWIIFFLLVFSYFLS